MRRSKKVFVAFAIAFALLLAYVAYDISSRTTFPGSSRDQVDEPKAVDTLAADTVR